MSLPSGSWPLPLAVGLSGGLDSCVLLHLLSRVCSRLPQSFSLSAIHVHHGLQPAADTFEAHCRALCTQLGVALQVIRLEIPDQEIAELGLEAAARKHRYRAMAQALPARAVLVLAHHRDDLIETALLQWVRGAGLEGLSAMQPFSNSLIEGQKIARWRPLLDTSRASIEQYAQAHGLGWVEDPSNESTGFARNRIRHEVMPVLRSLRSGADAAMARSVGHLQTARAMLELLTEQALSECLAADESLELSSLLAQSDGLASRVIRAWLGRAGIAAPPARRLAEFLRQLRQAREPYAQMHLAAAGSGQPPLYVARERGHLRIKR